MNKLGGYLRLMRPVNCSMMGFAVIVGAALATPELLNVDLLDIVCGFITGFMLTAASMVINDYYDREIDAVNEPNRPIPRGLVKPNEALVFAIGLTSIGFAAAYLTNVYCFAIGVIAWLVFLAYTTVGKRSGLPGNFLVSICVSIPFIYGSVAMVEAVGLNITVFVSMVFLSNTGREITKGIADTQGDRLKNVRTLAVRYSEKTAAIVAALFFVSAVSLSPIPWILKLVSFWFIPLVAVTDFGLAGSSILLLNDYSSENARKIKKVVLFCFFFGLLAFLIGVIR